MADDHSEQSSATPETQAAPQKKNTARRKAILTGVIAILAVGAGAYWFLTRNEIETDDAFTAGRAVGICPHVDLSLTHI
mgnify:CR=1 FL=1